MLDAADTADRNRPDANFLNLFLSEQTCPRARLIWSDAPLVADLTYIAVRPTFEFGDCTIGSTFAEAEGCQLQVSEFGRPSYAVAIYDSVVDAVDDALSVIRLHPRVKLWYDGQETQVLFTSWSMLAVLLSEADEAWKLVSQVAEGQLPSTDSSVYEATLQNPLIGFALEKVQA